MKTGFCLLLWTTSVDASHRALLEDLKATGYDGVEIPIFDGTPDEYARLGEMLDDIGLERTGISALGSLDVNPLSEDADVRRAASERLGWLIDCTAALGASTVGGPLHQTLGHFSGHAPTEEERKRCREVHLSIADKAQAAGVTVALEAVNRFESYFVTTMQQLADYIASVDHPAIRGMYDTFHANLEEADPIAAFDTIRPVCAHVHISENDRGVPGRGHVPFVKTLGRIRASGYDGWLTIEAFGRGLPELAAATRVWRDFAESPEAVYREGHRTIVDGWAAGDPARSS